MAVSQKHLQPALPPSEDSPAETDSAANRVPVQQKRFGLWKHSDASENHSGGFKSPGKDAVSSTGVSVTVLTLDASPRTFSRNGNANGGSMSFAQQILTAEREFNIPDLKYIRDFQTRKKYGRRSSTFPSPRLEKSYSELGLLGTKYFNNPDNNNNVGHDNNNGGNNHNSNGNNSNTNGNNAPLSSRLVKRSTTSFLMDDSRTLFPNGSLSVSPFTEFVTPLGKTDAGRVSADSVVKDLNAPLSTSFPPLSPSPRAGAISENSFCGSRHPGQTSLLMNDFGFNTIRTDTFSGLKRQRRLKNGSTPENEDLFRELEQHAQKQILACQNMGYFHRGSRAAKKVLSLKETVSPSAFHPPAFFTRHAPRESSREATSRGGEDERRRPRKLTHPGPAGKLSVPRLLVHDRQEELARRTTLPSVSGSSMRVMLAHPNAK